MFLRVVGSDVFVKGQPALASRRSKPFPFFFQIRFYMRQNPFYPEVELNFISTFWPNLPSGLQAAYEFAERDEIRFFKGNASPYCSVTVNSSALRLNISESWPLSLRGLWKIGRSHVSHRWESIILTKHNLVQL